jgi:glycosyltransferase involved in cell wall biosynthesis
MNKQSLVSIIIPTYNRANLLSRAIESVLSQTYQNLELIIVDDCSQDSTQEVVNKYLAKDKRIISLRNKSNEGQCYSFNIGIGESRGEFVALLDDDCEFMPMRIEEGLALMNSITPRPDIIYNNLWIEKERERTMLPLSKQSKLLTQKDIFSCNYTFMEPSAWFCDKMELKKIHGFDTNLTAYSDMDVLFRVLLSSGRIYFHNAPLVVKHMIKGLSALSLEYLSNKEKFLRKHEALFNEHKNYLSRFYYCMGKDFLKLSQFDKAKTYFWQAFLRAPTHMDYLLKSIYPGTKPRHI